MYNIQLKNHRQELLLLELAYNNNNNSNNNLIIHIFIHEVQSNAGPLIPYSFSSDPTTLAGQSIIPGNQAIRR